MSASDPAPPVPQHVEALNPDEKVGRGRFHQAWMQWFVQIREKINLINESIANMARLSGTGFASRETDGGWNLRTITGTTDRITVSNGDGVSGNPTINFADEGIQDVVAAMLVAGTNVTLSYDDTSGQLTINSSGGGGGGIDTGTVNPGSPATNDLFLRTDLGWLIFYDGTRWLTLAEFEIGGGISEGSQSFFSTSPIIPWRGAVRSDHGIYLTRWVSSSRVNTTNTGSAYWTVALFRQAADTTGTQISSYNTSADSPTTIVQHDQAINAVLDSSAKNLFVQGTKTGSPGAAHFISAIYYRVIVT